MKRIKYEIDPEDKITGVKAMSLVDAPAMESEFIAFSKEHSQYVELKLEGYKQVVAGMALIPEKDILRQTSDGEKYLAYFTRESIERIRNKFHKEMMTSHVNVDHSQQDYIDGYLIESFIIDSEERLSDLAKRGIKDPVMGSWFVAYKIEDEHTFNRVLKGELKGFSVEIFVNRMFNKVIPTELQEIKDSVSRIENLLNGTAIHTKSIQNRRLQLLNSKLKYI